MKLKLARSSTSRIARLYCQDTSSTTGGGLTGLTSASSGLTCYYIREGDASATAVSLSGGTVGTWSSGGFKEVDSVNLPGLYELGLPNAALSTGNSVVVMLKGATNLAPTLLEIELDAVNYQSATAFITGVNSLAPPTNWNLFSLDSSGRTLLQPTQAGVTIPTVTSLTNAPADSAGVGTLLTRVPNTLPTFPTNFAAFSIDGSGRVTVISNADKTGYALSASQTFNLTGNVTGNLSGSVGSVTGAVGSVAGNVGGNVVGSVGSVAAAVTAGTVSDKTGYALTTAEHTAISGTDVPAALTAQGYTTTRAGYLDTLNGLVAAVWGSVSRTLTAISDSSGVTTLLSRLTAGRATGLDNLDAAVSSRSTYAGADTAGTTTLLTRLPSAISLTAGAVTVGTNNDKSGYSGAATNLPADYLSTAEQTFLARLDTTVSSCMATFTYTAPANPTDYARNNVAPSWWAAAPNWYTAPDNADVATALSDLVTLVGRADPTTALTTLQTAATAIRAKTDLLTFTGSNVNAAISGDATTTLYGDAGAVAYTYTVYDVGGVTPLPGAAVYVSADSGGAQRSQTKVTDSLGRVTFQLDAGTVYFWASHPDRTFSNPVTEVIGP